MTKTELIDAFDALWAEVDFGHLSGSADYEPMTEDAEAVGGVIRKLIKRTLARPSWTYGVTLEECGARKVKLHHDYAKDAEKARYHQKVRDHHTGRKKT